MKKLILVLSLLLILTLTACDNGKLDYDDFSDISLESNADAENMSNNIYIVYYYQESCSHCLTIKEDILAFADTFTLIDFYIIDTSSVDDIPSVPGYSGTPSVFVFSGGEVIERYVGFENIPLFIDIYSNLEVELDYDSFRARQLTTYQQILNVNSDKYLVYYYLDSCPSCIEIKDQFLEWAININIRQLYIMNGAVVEDPDNIPTELQILSSGTPLLIVMSNGEFTDEYYLGKDDILEYIELVGKSDIN
jgi:thiol-disulfide isomerase/thioredoxin